MTLDPYERWMARSNVEHIAHGANPTRIVETLRVGGYEKVADAVEIEIKTLDAFVRGYKTCALWSSNDNIADPEGHGHPLDADHDIEDFTDEAHARMLDECHRFIVANYDDLAVYCERVDTSSDGDEPAAYAGHDFWLTRNGHGAGFYDRREVGSDVTERLTAAAQAWGEQNIEATGPDGSVEIF
jgi:hypothetical protein